jgi:hypothetical protein
MGPILQFIRPHDVFDAEMLTVLSDAFDKAIASLQDHGQRPIVRETMAIRILDLAAKGERDPDRLYRAALVRLVLDYRCRVRSGADVAFTGRLSFGSMYPTLMMKFFAQLLSR